VTASKLAVASGVTGGTRYALLRRLTELGELEKRGLASGQTGYAVDGESAAATSVPAAAHASEVSTSDSGPGIAQTGESQDKPAAAGSASSASKQAS
jgi:hypothetical protein